MSWTLSTGLVTVLVVVLILFVILQIIQTVLKVLKPKQKMVEKASQPKAVVVQGSKTTRTTSSKMESRSRKSSSRRGSLPSKRLCTVLSLSTESECEKTGKSSKELCTGSRECDQKARSDTSIPPLEMSKEMAASLKMLNCSDVVNTPLPSTAPLAVPHTPSKSKSASKESTDDLAKEKKKESPTKTAPTQPLSSLPIIPTTPTKAPPTQAPPPPTTPATVTTATNKSPAVDTTQRGSITETLTPGPKKNSPGKTAREDVKATPTPAPATLPPSQ
ncbi:hypothetical protein PENTCL1PPCAC_6817 [Pristionchus entomophagus]|uniref:Uncharacterized protein n=1 Tax=Pristionchus entomophagus TaxID=358040 RepID=A0AAV5SMP8_9BILA|nr:hypothetical protein PENTCL1PPCAC_6817 [Pristionchus entomophagus]